MTPVPGPPKDESSDPKRWPVRRAESFGGVVLRRTDGRPEVALIKARNLKDEPVWALPKGGREEGEEPEDAALREVREETDLDARIVQPLEDITYWFVSPREQARYRKTVHLYLMEATGGDTSAHDNEVDEVRFVPVEQAAAIATYPADRRVLQRVAELARTW